MIRYDESNIIQVLLLNTITNTTTTNTRTTANTTKLQLLLIKIQLIVKTTTNGTKTVELIIQNYNYYVIPELQLINVLNVNLIVQNYS